MSEETTANAVRGRGIGALFFTGFGALWLVLGLYAREQLSALALVLVASATAVLAAGAAWLIAKAKRLPQVEADARMGRVFGWINLVQWTAVGVVAYSFARLHIDAYVMSAITAIVGAHMLPLARLFRYKMHYVTGAVLMAWAAASVFLFPAERLQGATALGTGAILWASAMVTVMLAVARVRAGMEMAKG